MIAIALFALAGVLVLPLVIAWAALEWSADLGKDVER